MPDVIVSGGLRIPIGLHPDYEEHVRQELTFPNPFEPEEFLSAYVETTTELIVPRGFPLVGYEAVPQVIDSSAIISVGNSYNLRDYQEPAVNEILSYLSERDYGQLLFTALCGSGKSFSLAGILSSLGMKTLVLSHLTMLNVQIFNELSENLVDTDIRLISSKNIGKDLPDIAIASFAALNSSRKLLELCANTYSLLVIDEGENAITSSRIAVILGLKFKYLIFMTATPTRELTQQTPAVKYFYGDKVVTMTQPEEVKIHSHHIMVDYRNLHWQSPVNPKMYKTQFGRFLLKSPILGNIVTLCHSIKTSGIPGCIWLVADLSVIKIKMKTLLEKTGLIVEIIDSKTKTKERTRIIKDITNGLIDVVIGSAPISAGLSIKELIVGIRLIPSSSSEETLEQSTGRLNRNCPFKKDFTPLWVDYVCSGSLEYNAKKRFQRYKGSTLGVSFVKPQELVKVSLSKIKGD